MISEQELRSEIYKFLGDKTPRNIQIDKLHTLICTKEKENNVVFSVYGYIIYVLENYGSKALYANVLTSEKAVSGYFKEYTKQRDDMPLLLLNARDYSEHVLETIPDIDLCIKKLTGMSYPYVLYILFKGSDQGNFVEEFKESTQELLKKYPSILSKLPDRYKKVGEDIMNENIR